MAEYEPSMASEPNDEGSWMPQDVPSEDAVPLKFYSPGHWSIADLGNGGKAKLLITDRGDAPAQAVLDRNTKAQADRRAEETKYELNKINARVEQTVAAFELINQFQEDDKAAYFVPDLMELEKVVGDAIQKRKYQQHVMIFVVGFEEATEEKVKLLSQINDFFTIYINNIDEKQLEEPETEIDLEEVSTSVQEALATADQATQRLSEINHEIVSYMEKKHNGKALTKNKKKLEKALSQAKEDIMGLSEKLLGAQAEIEDKEDQMTKLYKQIDIKNVETMKHKTAAENAKKKLAEIDDLQSLIDERDNEIERLKKAAFEQELSIKQMMQSRESSYTKLKGTQKDSEESIQKLQGKVQNLQLLLEDTKADLQKQHRIQVSELKQEHQLVLEGIEHDLQRKQEKIDQLESEALNAKKAWALDSDEEAEVTSKPASSRQGISRKSTKNAPSRLSELPTGTPQNNSAMKAEDHDPSAPNTPKRPSTKKTNLGPLPEVVYEGPVSLEDENKWSSVPQEMIPSAFKQYRKEAILVVKGLQDELKTTANDHVEKVTKMTEQIQYAEETFKKEKSDMIKQVDASTLLKEAAEKEADKALAQLESFVAEHGEMVKLAEPEKKELKKLTPEQRAKYLGKEVKENKKNIKGRKPTKKESSSKSKVTTIRKQADESKNEEEPRDGESEKKEDKSQEGIPALTLEKTCDTRKKESVDKSQQTSPRESEMSDSEGEDEVEMVDAGADDEETERPSSAFSQQSLYEKFKAQLEQTKQEVIERRSRATSMHGSLLSGKNSRVGSAKTDASDIISSHGEKTESGMKADIGTSPLLLTPAAGNSRKSSISAYDHPIVLDYLKTYDIINDVKLSLSQAFADKDLTRASNRLGELTPVIFNREEDPTAQINEMALSAELFLQEISAVLTDYLNQEPDAAVSSLMSRSNTGRSRLTTAPSVGVQTRLTGYPDPLPVTPPSEPPKTAASNATTTVADNAADIVTSLEYRQLKEDYDRLLEESDEAYREAGKMKEDIAIQKQTHDGKLEDNALQIMELQGTIRQLQQELVRLEMTPSIKPGSSAVRAPSGVFMDSPSEPLVVFSRTDTERNQKVLKRGINSHRISPDQYNEAVRSMERYNSVPARRLVHIVKKYTHHTHMKHIEGNIKKSNSVDHEVFALLEKMEALQNKRAEQWGEQMDGLADERMKMAQQLMELLTKLEEESGIFLIKPILSWRGSGHPPYYDSKQSTYKPPKTFLRPVTREGSVIYGPAPTPTPSHVNRRVNKVETNDEVTLAYHRPPHSAHISTTMDHSSNSMQGSALHLVGTPPQGMWSLSSSLPVGEGAGVTNKRTSPLITTPKILELEVNRMMIGQNNVSSPSKPFLSDDRLVNAANGSIRSYVTIPRPSANPIPSRIPQRPNSTGTEYTRASTALPVSRSSTSAGLPIRAKSESALNMTQPLPPIKVPVEDGEYPVISTDDRGVSHPSLHPSPPHTPPGSSLRQTPADHTLQENNVVSPDSPINIHS